MKLAGVVNLRSIVIAWGLGMSALLSGPALAGAQDFVLNNATGVDIYELYVSPASTDEWQEDVLGADVLEDGNSLEISFDRDEDADYWDLMVVDGEGNNVQWARLKLTEIYEVTLRIQGGRAVAEVE